MNNFVYYTPTKVVFGKDTVDQVAELVKAYGGSKVLVHYGGGSAVKSGLIDRVKASLDGAGISYVELGGVKPNPRLSMVYEGIELCKKEGVDFLLAVGGGSVIDSAKAIGYGLGNEGDVWDFYDRKRMPAATAPVGVVLTIAAAGSEMSDSSVITNEDGWKKRGCNSDVCRVKFAIMDPELTTTLPDYQTACGCTDIIMHTLERYFTTKGTMELTDGLAAAVIKTVMKNALILKEDPKNYEARAEVMWASSLSHNGLTGCGNGGNDFATHRLEHELSGMYDVAHGAGLAALWGSWARYVMDNCIGSFRKFAVDVMGVEDKGDDKEVALKGVEKMEDFFRAIDMPTNMRELGLEPSDAEIEEMADKCVLATGGKVGAAKVLERPDFIAIYNMAR